MCQASQALLSRTPQHSRCPSALARPVSMSSIERSLSAYPSLYTRPRDGDFHLDHPAGADHPWSNKMFGKDFLIWQLTGRGFCSEITTMLLARLYCLDKNINFALCSKYWNAAH